MGVFGWGYLTDSDKEEILASVQSGQATGGPYHVEIHPADRCNIACFFCSTAAIRGTDELPLEKWHLLLEELERLGTRSIRLAGGGEPLFHRDIVPFLESVAATEIRIENITTNAIIMREPIAELLLQTCDEVTVSLNTVGEASYSAMMKTPEKNYSRVLDNIRSLVTLRNRAGKRSPRVQLQFLVWKENYRTVLEMYQLARELEVDSILFNGLSHLAKQDLMSSDQWLELLEAYEGIILTDGFRRIRSISSFERDISQDIEEIVSRLSLAKRSRSVFQKTREFLDQSNFSIAEKLESRRQLHSRIESSSQVQGLTEDCVIGFYSLVVRSDGTVAPCCILQDQALGNVYQQSVKDVWFGENYQRFRGELTDLLRAGEDWEYRANTNRVLGSGCGGATASCPMRSYYYRSDPTFTRALDSVVDR